MIRLTAAIARAALCAVTLSGCQWLLGDDGSECSTATDCPARMLCTIGRCVDDPTPAPDARVADLGTADMTTERAVDAAPADLDAGDEGVMPRVDAALPGEIDAPFPDGACFSNSASIQLGAGITYVPHGLCTRFGVLWTTDTPGGRALNIARVWPPDETVITVPMAADARVSTVDGRFIAFATPGLQGAPTPAVLDLAARAPDPVVIRDVPVSEVQRGYGMTAYVTDGTLFLNPDAEMFSTFVDCSQPATRQWGVALSQSRVAWFERALVGGPTRVVIADPTTCRNRVVFPAQGVIATDARVESAGARWLWIAAGPTGSQVVGLAPDARARLRPFALQMATSPSQIAAHGDWLATVSYGEGAWRIEALHLDDDRVIDLSAGSSNHRNPLIWNEYLSWAVMTRQGWGVQYAPLR